MLRVRIATASVLGAVLWATLFLLPPRATVFAFAVVLTAAAWEWAGFGGLDGRISRALYAAAIGAVLGSCWWWSRKPAHLLLLLGAACVWWFIAFLWLSLAPARHRPAVSLICGVPVLVPAFVALSHVQIAGQGFARGPQMVLWFLLLVFAADIGAYFAGRRFGAHKMAPRVSPGKTWEGAIGGVAASASVALFAAWRFGLPPAAAVAFGTGIAVFSIVGDLTESMFKRAAGLKDSGTILPGHGGILDRIDSVTAAAPLYALGLFGSGAVA